jgi:hypothetical protein
MRFLSHFCLKKRMDIAHALYALCLRMPRAGDAVQSYNIKNLYSKALADNPGKSEPKFHPIALFSSPLYR